MMTGMEAGVGEVAEGEEGTIEVAGREGNTADMVAQTSRKRLPVTLSVLGDVLELADSPAKWFWPKSLESSFIMNVANEMIERTDNGIFQSWRSGRFGSARI